MPKIFEYLGIIFFFYSNEHEPIHVHGRKGSSESKAEIVIVNGRVNEIKICPVKGSRPLEDKDLKHFKEFLKIYADAIVEKWIDYFIYHKNIKFEKITKVV